MSGIRLRHLAFTGPNIEPAELHFDEGLNIVYGASNTGKSFASKAILFAMGAIKKLPETKEIAAYTGVWLGVTLFGEGDFTLFRPTGGGHLKIHPGLVKSPGDGRAKALRNVHDHRREDTVSHRLLTAIGLANKWVVRDANGKKDSLSIRLLAKYVVVGEQDIMSETSPVYGSANPADRTFEQNLFKLILTGHDDSAAVTVANETARKAAKAAKIELVDELLAQLNAELGEENRYQSTIKRLEEADGLASALLIELQRLQKGIDDLVVDRRDHADRRQELQDRNKEIELTIGRFSKLKGVYESDLARLYSIEESGYVLSAMARRECPVCGALPEAQRHVHAADDISMAQVASTAEIAKIKREMGELALVVLSLGTEASEVKRNIQFHDSQVQLVDGLLEKLRPEEASLRKRFADYSSARDELAKVRTLHERREMLTARRDQIGAISTKRGDAAAPTGPSSTTVFDFGEAVKAVLEAWRFPEAEQVQFDGRANDITVGGKSRAANGKGVRAVLHAAFNVAVIVHCIENNLPHAGFLVLDTPLLTYREPLESRYGELAPDEEALKSTSLAEHFYRHLASLAEHVQVIVIENSDPPQSIEGLARITTFTGKSGHGRAGLLARAK